MSARGWKSWWSSPVPFAAISGLVVGAAIMGLISVAPPINNGMREAERFLAELGCRLPGPPDVAEPGP